MGRVHYPVEKIIACKQKKLRNGVREKQYLIEWSPAWIPVEGLGSHAFNRLKREFTASRDALHEPRNVAGYPTWDHVREWLCSILCVV
jgi:hypothetical protein